MKNFRQTCLGDYAGADKKCLIIAEVAQSHDGSLGQAHAFIDAIADAGADAVKFQTHIAEAESSPDEPWRIKFSPQDETRFDYWRRMEFTKEQWAGLKRHAEERGLLFLSSPFSLEAVELLEEIGMKVWKIASGEVGNLPLLERIAAGGKPVILSSGMSSWEEISEAVGLIRRSGNPFAVLQCTTAYPCPPEKIGLNVLDAIREKFDCPTGLSDHSAKIFPSLAAAALGAEVLEMHVCLSREMFGPDVEASVTTAELRQLIEGVRMIEKMLANPVSKDYAARELEPLKRIFSKSIYAGQTLEAGTILKAEHLKLKKPGTGIPASQLPNLVGLRLRYGIKAGEMLVLEHVELEEAARPITRAADFQD